MARFRYKHIQSTVEDKVPSDLLDGEIAVNRYAGKEKLYIKNTSNSMVSFSSDSAVDGKLSDKLNVSDFNTYSGAVDTTINSKAAQSDLNTLSGTVTGHTSNTDIHVTTAQTAAWDAKLDSSDIADFFDDAKYEDSGTSKVINFYNGNTIKATIDADDFIKDGMIDTVSVETSGDTSVLVITWNTDAGKSQTILDIGDIFEADNYYTKSETSGATEISTALDNKLNKTAFDDKLGSAFTGSNSGVTVTQYIEDNEEVISSAINDLQTRVAALEALIANLEPKQDVEQVQGKDYYEIV